MLNLSTVDAMKECRLKKQQTDDIMLEEEIHCKVSCEIEGIIQTDARVDFLNFV